MAGNIFQFDETNSETSTSALVADSHCTEDSVGLIIKKRALQKKFEECMNKESSYSVSIMFFTVAEGTSGTTEKDNCLMGYRDSLVELQRCAKTTLPE